MNVILHDDEGGSKSLTLAPTVEVVGDKIMPTEAFAKAQYQLGKEAEKAMNHDLRFGPDPAFDYATCLGPDPAFERAEERIQGRGNAMAFSIGLTWGMFLMTGVAVLAGWWK